MSGTPKIPSLVAYNWAWEQDIPLTVKTVLLNLAKHEDWDTHICYPRVSVIAKEIGASVRTVIRALATLEAKKLISRQPRGNEDGHVRSTLYTLNIIRTDDLQSDYSEIDNVVQLRAR